MVCKLSDEEREALFKNIPTWTYNPSQDSLQKTFHFDSFPSALGFMVTVGVEAQVANHHPEWFNVYDRVEVTWRTHECQGVSVRDVEMAQKCDAVYARHGAYK
jgi:4a-hydroxytetrahydrobiopterin dehydratase